MTISWSDTTSEEVDYGNGNKPTRYTRLAKRDEESQAKQEQAFVYSGTQLTRVNELTTGAYVTYYYLASKVVRAEQFEPGDIWSKTQVYYYYPSGQLHRVYQTSDQRTGADNPLETRQTFTYDTKGNMVRLVEASKKTAAGDYQDTGGWHYANYDRGKHTPTVSAMFPIPLPDVTFQVNNPASVTRFTVAADGSERVVEQTDRAYRYNTKGYPISCVQTTSLGSVTATYSYVE